MSSMVEKEQCESLRDAVGASIRRQPVSKEKVEKVTSTSVRVPSEAEISDE